MLEGFVIRFFLLIYITTERILLAELSSEALGRRDAWEMCDRAGVKPLRRTLIGFVKMTELFRNSELRRNFDLPN